MIPKNSLSTSKNGEERPSIDELTSLRGIAAVLVVFHHLGLLMLPLRPTFLGPALGKFGLLGMSIFFVLSGFVIHYNYGLRIQHSMSKGSRDFIVARVARLYPLLWVVLISNYILDAITLAHSSPARASLATATLPLYMAGIQSWFYSVLNGVNVTIAQGYANNSWSISSEIFLYILYIPIAFALKAHVRLLRSALILGFLAVFGRVALTLIMTRPETTNWFVRSFGVDANMPPDVWVTYFSPYGRFFDFLGGVAVAQAFIAVRNENKSRLEVLLMRALGAASALYVGCSLADGTVFSAKSLFSFYAVMVGYALATMVGVYQICRCENLLNKLLLAAPLIWLGEISYSLYLLHGEIFPLFVVGPQTSLIDHIFLMSWRSALFITTLLIAASVAYRFIEMPARRKVRALLTRVVVEASPKGGASTLEPVVPRS